MSAAGAPERLWRSPEDQVARSRLRLVPGRGAEVAAAGAGASRAGGPARPEGVRTAPGAGAGREGTLFGEGGPLFGEDGTLFGEEGAAEGPLSALLEQLHEVCASAVDPLEIAAALEFEGIGDTQAERYGCTSVFELAEAAFAATSRRPADPDPAPDPWATERRSPAVHALCYGLPALCFPSASALLRGPGSLAVLVVTLLVAWSSTQGVGALGYARLGAGQEATGAIRLAGLAAFLLVAAAASAAALLTHAGTGLLLFALGEGAYMAAAAILLTLGRARALLASLAPGALSGAVYLLAGRPAGAAPVVWLFLAATPLGAIVLATLHTRGAGRALPAVAELAAAVPAVLFGLAAASLLALPVAAGRGPKAGALLASVPISLSMGVGEWRLLWYRRRMQRLLVSTGDLGRFAHGARRALLAATFAYAAAAGALLAAAALAGAVSRLVPIGPEVRVELVAYLLLAIAMFVALVLQALGARPVAVALAGAAAIAEAALDRFGALALLAIAAGLLGALGAYALVELARATRHG